jgi:hypothetical protein
MKTFKTKIKIFPETKAGRDCLLFGLVFNWWRLLPWDVSSYQGCARRVSDSKSGGRGITMVHTLGLYD